MTQSTSNALDDSLPPIAQMALDLHIQGFNSVRLAIVQGSILIEGSVPDYAAKRRIEEDARLNGFSVRNSLRVVPGPTATPRPESVLAAAVPA